MFVISHEPPKPTMSFLTNPLSFFGAPLLFLVSLPLAVFAAFTTGIAISLLAIRASVVYFELGVALLHASLFPEPAKPAPSRVIPPKSPPRVRRISTSSQNSTPGVRLNKRSGSSASLINVNQSSSANARDFEGVGGWRYYEGEKEEAIWMGMNKRLQLPLALPPGRRHQRRHTGEEQRWAGSPETFRMSPLQSRTRTPQRTPQRTPKPTASPGEDHDEDEGYFPSVLRPLSTAMEPLSLSVQHSRRASVVSAGGSSSSSPSSEVLK